MGGIFNLADIERLGVLPLQHHDPGWDIDMRIGVYATRTEYDAENGIMAPVRGTAGDLLCSLVWEIESDNSLFEQAAKQEPGKNQKDLIPSQSRPCPAWAWAWPAVVTSVPEHGGDLSPSGTGTITIGFATNSEDSGWSLRPSRNFWEADRRFVSKAPAMPNFAGPVPKGWGCMVPAGTEEKAQTELCLPGFYGLVAENRRPNQFDTGTRIFDLGADDTPGPWARLQSAWRVVRTRGGVVSFSASGQDNALAWQLGLSGARDMVAGYGLCVDFNPNPQAPPPTPAPTRQRPVTGVPPGHEPVMGGLPYGPPVVDFVPYEGGGTRARNDGDEPPEPPPDPALASASILGAASQRAGGPFDVGPADDQHRLGVTEDGEPVNSMHLSTLSLFVGSGGDAPVEFAGIYPKPPSMPEIVRAHLSIDPDAGHPWVGGGRRGLWRLWAESAFSATGTDDGGGGTDGGDDGGGTIPEPTDGGMGTRPRDGGPTDGGGVGIDPPVVERGGTTTGGMTGGMAGLPPTTAAKAGGQPKGSRNPTAAEVMIATTGDLMGQRFVFRADDFSNGLSPTVKGMPGPARAEWGTTAPAIINIQAAAKQPAIGFSASYTQKPGQSRFPGGTASGHLVFFPPEVDVIDAGVDYQPLDRTISTAHVTYGPNVVTGHGVPDLVGGGMKTGWETEYVPSGNGLTTTPYTNGSWTPGNTLTFQSKLTTWGDIKTTSGNVKIDVSDYSFSIKVGGVERTIAANATHFLMSQALQISGGVRVNSGIRMTEDAAVPDSPNAGQGTFWVRNDTPNVPMFTDDTPASYQLMYVGALPTAHNILSASHGDTLAGAVVLGDLVHGNGTPKWARLAGNITTTKQYLSQTGTGAVSAVPAWAQVDHNADLANLATGDVHTQYPLLAGRAGGQTLIGGTAAGKALTLQSTAHATRGAIVVSDWLQVGTAATGSPTTGDFAAGLTGAASRMLWDQSAGSLTIHDAAGNARQQFIALAGNNVYDMKGGYILGMGGGATTPTVDMYGTTGTLNVRRNSGTGNGGIGITFTGRLAGVFTGFGIFSATDVLMAFDASHAGADLQFRAYNAAAAAKICLLYDPDALTAKMTDAALIVGTSVPATGVGDIVGGITGTYYSWYDASEGAQNYYGSAGTLSDRVSSKATVETVFNELGADIDHRIEGAGQVNALFVQGSDGFVGVATGAPTSSLHCAASAANAIASVAGDTTLGATHCRVKVDASGGAVVITLPAAAGAAGRLYYIKKTDSSANTVTVDGNGAETIDGNATLVLYNQNNAVCVQSDGTNWVAW